MILWTTFGAWRAHIVVDAWIYALFVLAGLVRRAVIVAGATNDTAALVGISAIAAETATLGTTRLNVAFGIGAARIVEQAGIDAVAIDAGLARVAFAIDATANGATGGIRIALKAILTAAHRAMLLHLANGVGAAVARVPTLAIDTGLLFATIRITFTAWWTL